MFPQKNAFKVGIDYYFVLSRNNEGSNKATVVLGTKPSLLLVLQS